MCCSSLKGRRRLVLPASVPAAHLLSHPITSQHNQSSPHASPTQRTSAQRPCTLPERRPLSAHSIAIFRSMTELFDHYLLSCFILFGGVTLETLVFQVRVMGMPGRR